MAYDRTMTEAVSRVWHKAAAMDVQKLYSNATRNPDKAIRDQFKADRKIRGTLAWGICEAIRLINVNATDAECEAIESALAAAHED